jgi:hypothetical protein
MNKITLRYYVLRNINFMIIKGMLKSKTVIELLHCSNRNKITKVFLER